MREVWGPEGDGAVLVSEVNDSVVGVLTHGVACAEFGTMLYDELARRGILVFDVACVALKKVSWNERTGDSIDTRTTETRSQW